MPTLVRFNCSMIRFSVAVMGQQESRLCGASYAVHAMHGLQRATTALFMVQVSPHGAKLTTPHAVAQPKQNARQNSP